MMPDNYCYFLVRCNLDNRFEGAKQEILISGVLGHPLIQDLAEKEVQGTPNRLQTMAELFAAAKPAY